MKRIKCFLWLCACVLLFGSAVTVKAEDTTGDEAYTSEESYTKRSFTDLYQAKDLELDSDITAIENTEANGLLLAGSAEAFSGSRIKIGRTFNFDGNRIGRVSLDALAGYGENLTVYLYLDNETEPFATFTPKKQGRDDLWTKDICLEEDVLAKNIRGENHTISLSVENADSGKTEILLRSIEFVESGLPTVYMNIDESHGTIAAMNQSKDHSAECYGSMTVEIPQGYTNEFGDSAGSVTVGDSSDTYELSYLRGRGNSTWDLDKKPYRLKLDKKADLFGMGAAKNWVLLANRYDNSKLRNQITYWLGRDLGMAYTPNCVQIDLVMNGVYYGNYLLTQQLRVDENSIAIDDLEADEATKQSIDPSVISGGYYLSVGSNQNDDSTLYNTSRNFCYLIESPSFDGYTNETQLNYIKDYIQKTEDAIFASDFKDSDGVSYSEYMDVDSAVDYFWIQEFSKNGDAFGTDSTHFYKVRNGKIYWGPLWDFDSVAWDCGNYGETEGYLLRDSGDAKWFSRLLADPVFASKVTERWQVVRESLLNACKDGGQIDQYYDQMSTSMRYDVEKWGLYFAEYGIGEIKKDGETPTFLSEKERLKEWMQGRIQWIDDNLSSLQRQSVKLTYKVNGKTYYTDYVIEGDFVDSIPSAPEKTGYVFKGWRYYSEDEDGYDLMDETTRFTADTTLNAYYVAEAKNTTTKNLYLSTSEIWLSKDSEPEYLLDATVYPSTGEEIWDYTSSDENVLTITSDGIPEIIGVGDTTVTVTCDSLKKTCLVHVYDPETTNIGKSDISISKTSLTLQKGKYQQLKIIFSTKEHSNNNFQWVSMDSDIVSVDACGVVTANDYGTTYVILRDLDTKKYRTCKVTVPAPKSTIKKGSTYTYKGLKYKVTYKAKKGGNVTILGPTGKKIKRVNIRSTLKIKGETFKVTGISYKAFYKCKNLRKIYMGNNIKYIGNKAFTGIRKNAVFRVPASKKKAYKKLLTSKKGFKKTMKVTK